MKPSNQNYAHLINPNICCPKSCANCNECYMNALQPSTCSISKGNMCDQDDEGKQKCCANKVDKVCLENNEIPCRLSELDQHNL